MHIPWANTKYKCDQAGGYWGANACWIHKEDYLKFIEETGYIPPTIPPPPPALGAESLIAAAYHLINDGEQFFNTWTGLTFQEPPKDLFGRIFWSLGVLGQGILSTATFPFAIAGFLMEESVQGVGMGAYMLATAKMWEELDTYLHTYKSTMDAAVTSTKTIATLNPVVGGASLFYIGSAMMSYEAFRKITDRKLIEAYAEAERIGEKIDWASKHGTLRIQSTPNYAEIWIDNVNTEYITPETFKDMDVGTYDLTLRRYSARREVWDIFSFTTTIEPGRKREIFVRIPPKVTTDEETPGQTDEGDEPILPNYINAQVKGEYAIDGDTFTTTTGERIRLLAIDAPELGRPWALESKESLGLNIEDKNIQLRIQTHKSLDEYGRTLAICSNYKGDISTFQLSAGLATVFIHEDDIYDTQKYISAEQVAKDRHIGIWS